MTEPAYNELLFMQQCLELAEKGRSQVAPNPMVGALLLIDDQIIGEGYHERFGAPHAEAQAIRSVANPEQIKKSTLYVNLEPCTHQGKTPPCTGLILEHGIRQVVIGCRDPNPEVGGGGIQLLESKGVAVRSGVLAGESIDLNRRFFLFQKQQRPYVILKWAETSDGFIARSDNTSKWISNETSRKRVHEWRAQETAVLVGTDTALYDNPRLNVRRTSGRNPIRIVIDRRLRLPAELRLFDRSQETWVFSTLGGQTRPKCRFFTLEDSPDFLQQMLQVMYREGVLSLIVEGGAKLLGSFIEAGLWDEARVFRSAKEFGVGVKTPLIDGDPVTEEQIEDDTLFTYRSAESLSVLEALFE